MKKFSTAACLIALSSLFASMSASAQEDLGDAPKIRCEFRPNAPDQHTVVKGDTLWDISGKFLEHPWCWPQVWGLNRDEIRDPHWIYPGQIVYFDRAAGRLRLGTPTGGSTGLVDGTVKLSPQARIEGLGRNAIPSIPASVIEPFLIQPLIVEEKQLKSAPYIMATQEGRVNLGKDDRAYVRGDLKGGSTFQVFRPAKPLRDPDNGKVIAYEAAYLGTVKLVREATASNEAHSFVVVSSKEEMGVGDRLLPMPPTPILNYVPHPPDKKMSARVVSIYGGVDQAGQSQVVAINRGKMHGIDLGTVLELYSHGATVKDTVEGKRNIKLPDERFGTLFVFRVFDRVSYALIMQVTNSVKVGDVARSPE
ncbi:MAG: LysM peptidoglycan-binding protein [Paucimonas sp.]|nr:LysM peptidoglycan-binding protein [Paucimonas sp.]